MGLVKKVLFKVGVGFLKGGVGFLKLVVGFLKLVDFQILFIICLIESSKACGVSCEGCGVVF